MKCNYCGYSVSEETVYCPNCGEKVDTTKKNEIKEVNEKTESAKEEVKQVQNNYGTSDSSYSFLWGILGYFIPVVGLILFVIWRETKPKDSKAAGIGALVSVITNIIFMIIMVIVLAYSFSNFG